MQLPTRSRFSEAVDAHGAVEDVDNVHAVVFDRLRDDVAQVKELVRRGRVILHRMFLGLQVVHQTGRCAAFLWWYPFLQLLRCYGCVMGYQ